MNNSSCSNNKNNNELKKSSSRTTLYNTLNVVQHQSKVENLSQSDRLKETSNRQESNVLCSNQDNQIALFYLQQSLTTTKYYCQQCATLLKAKGKNISLLNSADLKIITINQFNKNLSTKQLFCQQQMQLNDYVVKENQKLIRNQIENIDQLYKQLIQQMEVVKAKQISELKNYEKNRQEQLQKQLEKIEDYNELVNSIKKDMDSNLKKIVHEIEEEPLQQIIMNYNLKLASYQPKVNLNNHILKQTQIYLHTFSNAVQSNHNNILNIITHQISLSQSFLSNPTHQLSIRNTQHFKHQQNSNLYRFYQNNHNNIQNSNQNTSNLLTYNCNNNINNSHNNNTYNNNYNNTNCNNNSNSNNNSFNQINNINNSCNNNNNNISNNNNNNNNNKNNMNLNNNNKKYANNNQVNNQYEQFLSERKHYFDNQNNINKNIKQQEEIKNQFNCQKKFKSMLQKVNHNQTKNKQFLNEVSNSSILNQSNSKSLSPIINN